MPSPLTAFRATQVTAQVYWLQVWLAFAAEAQARQYLHYYDTIKRARPLTADGAPKSSARELTELLAMLGPGAWRAPAFFDGVGALAHTRTPPPPSGVGRHDRGPHRSGAHLQRHQAAPKRAVSDEQPGAPSVSAHHRACCAQLGASSG